jgi:hypothetical protein
MVMKKLFLLLALIGCTSSSPTELVDEPYIKFSKDIDSLSIIRNVQTFKPLALETNLPDQTKVIWESDIWVKVRVGVDSSYITNRLIINWPYVDTVTTVNCCSYTYKGSARSVFGAFEIMRGQTATVIASTKVGKKVLADTVKIVMY